MGIPGRIALHKRVGWLWADVYARLALSARRANRGLRTGGASVAAAGLTRTRHRAAGTHRSLRRNNTTRKAGLSPFWPCWCFGSTMTVGASTSRCFASSTRLGTPTMGCFASTLRLEASTIRRFVPLPRQFSSRPSWMSFVDQTPGRIVEAASLVRREICFIAEARQLAARIRSSTTGGRVHYTFCRTCILTPGSPHYARIGASGFRPDPITNAPGISYCAPSRHCSIDARYPARTKSRVGSSNRE